MKKILTILAVILVLALPVVCMAAGSCVQTYNQMPTGNVTVKFTCTGDAAGETVGTIPTQTITGTAANLIKGLYLYQVISYPTPGGTAPDAANVTVNQDGQDLLGGKGANLIHATLTYDVFPYSTFMSKDRLPMITGTITYAVTGQITASANWTTELQFGR